MKRPTIADIARQAGVSKVAVSYALNGQPGVSDRTRASIRRIAAELGWRPSSAARALTGSRAGVVGLAMCRPAGFPGVEPFFMELISGIEAVLAERDNALMLQIVPDHERETEVYHRWWGEGRVDGVIVLDPHHEDPRIPVLEGLRLPAVVVGHPSAAGGLTAVWSDDSVGVREAVRHLAGAGHRRLARVAGPTRLTHTALRDGALRETCAELGLPAPRITHTDHTGEGGADATRALLTAPDRPTAIVFDNDIMAVACLSVAAELGLSIPADLSVIAWDDSPLTRVVRPALTALGRDIAAYGGRAATALLTVIEEGRPAGEPGVGVEEPPARLIPRGSTGPPPGGV
ncbi:LacI family DNA-binding transcriptional regulator [Streptomyces sp. ST2-7A]|uniref:LacI family DNA-binding transcriptional regulator n=1 Tax=Streptomyces sp. ST2-7A TaxID=2907214 RepID=UPI001F3C0CFB|nr:LacI family DNA-binding transcriptional regulator [Streptomyces sp. ST2-7A]MCE7082508.1 LacI family transcriptional regulator [Streptomyces sp. ST2-7A]